MNTDSSLPIVVNRRQGTPWIGSLGHVILLTWMFCLVLIVPVARLWWSAGFALVAAVLLYPASFRRLLRLRILLLLGMVFLASLFFGAQQPDSDLFGIPYSSSGLVGGLQMVVRAVVILVAVDGFSSAVEIGEVAGMIERLGLRGLGFSIGVAFNLLPVLRQAAANTWRAMWMRGGLRSHRVKAMRLMLVTIITNALRRGDEIALAAEARAFTPERSRAIPLRPGKLDYWLTLPLLGILLAILFIPAGWH